MNKFKVLSKRHLVVGEVNYKPGDVIDGMAIEEARQQQVAGNVEITVVDEPVVEEPKIEEPKTDETKTDETKTPKKPKAVVTETKTNETDPAKTEE